mmetsp:Transcript_71749/g.167972  ORF Transcript_71749/g.167972 Transcript_71749/m.167972 type:complete len:100 (+) Transcript_71749:1746-2045(+)
MWKATNRRQIAWQVCFRGPALPPSWNDLKIISRWAGSRREREVASSTGPNGTQASSCMQHGNLPDAEQWQGSCQTRMYNAAFRDLCSACSVICERQMSS